ncbi:fibropellin-1-like [Anneissia japonica]|uniref:fibropellin-1-like n=1 Tax=Anneissia japonica TaxID=1529436 RepID=UPI0014259C52|nr:fibropellin-1-like [Anneissia japonica]
MIINQKMRTLNLLILKMLFIFFSTTRAENDCNRGDGTSCDTTECDINPCQNGAACVDGGGYYTCECPVGWHGINCDESTAQNCGYNIYEATGEITSPNYPNAYDDRLYCVYLVRVHKARSMMSLQRRSRVWRWSYCRFQP